MSARERLVWVTAAGQRVDHAVTADDLAAGIGAAGKEIVALCGRRFVAAPLIAEPGGRCTACDRYARARATLPTVEQRLQALGTRGGWLAALVSRSPVTSSRFAPSAPPDEVTGLSSWRTPDARFRTLSRSSGFRHAPTDAPGGGMISEPQNVYRAPVQWAVCPCWPVVDQDAPMTRRFASDPERTSPRYRLSDMALSALREARRG